MKTKVTNINEKNTTYTTVKKNSGPLDKKQLKDQKIKKDKG